MDKGDAVSHRPRARYLVDQVKPSRATGFEGRFQIGHSVADVVNAGAASREEPSNWSVGVERREQLDVRLAERKYQNRCPIDHLRGIRLDAENIPVESQRPVQVGDGDGDSNMGNVGAISHWSLRTGEGCRNALRAYRPT